MYKLFVGNIPASFSDGELADLFRGSFRVISARVVRDKYSGQSREFGIVEVDQEREARSLISAFNGKMVEGVRLVVNEARIW